MASASPDDNNDLPVIWLLPPPGLQPPKPRFLGLKVAIAVGVAVVVFLLIFTPLYCIKRRALRKAKESDKHVELKKTIRVVPLRSPASVSYRTGISSKMWAYEVEDHPGDSAHRPTQATAVASRLAPPRISYNIPSYYENAGASNDHGNGSATRALSLYPWQTPSSSIYSDPELHRHSGLYPAPLVISKSGGPDKVSDGANKQDEAWV